MSHRIVQLNQETFLIDMDLFGIREVGAAYLIKGEKTCLIDSGMEKEAANIVKALDSVKLFPDILILTHSHFDHSQGTPFLKREAERRGRKLGIMASEKAVANLNDQSWNNRFKKGNYEDIKDVTPLKDGEKIDLKSTELTFYDLSGHCADDLGIFDAKNKTLYTGDCLGYKIQDLIIPPFMPPFWSEENFKRTISKVKGIDYEKLCFAHFGCLEGEIARIYPSKIEETTKNWWQLFQEIDSEGKTNDISYVINSIKKNLDIKMPDLKLESSYAKILLFALNLFNKITGKEKLIVADLQVKAIVEWLLEGYKNSMNTRK